MEATDLNERQREIVDTTMRLVSTKGLHELTMKKIAAEIGISEPALYRHFQSKSDILSALIDTLDQNRQIIVRKAEKEGESLRSFMEGFFLGHARLFQERPGMTLILFSEDLFSADAALALRVRSMMEGTMGLLQRRIGDAGGGPDTLTTGLLLVGGFRLLVSLWRMGDHDFDLEARTRLFLSEAFARLGL